MKISIANPIFTAHCIIIISKQITLMFIYSKNLHVIPLSQGKFFLMIGSLEVTHEIILTIHSVIQISSIT